MRGYTRSGVFGPMADFVDSRGGSIERVFRRVDLPLTLLDNPNLPLPLSENFRVLAQAGREIGDPFLGASLGCQIGISDLGVFGNWIGNAPTLASSIDRCRRGVNRYLQTATLIQLRQNESTIQVSIEFLDGGTEGRFQNELLALSYLMEMVRQFAGPSWAPKLIRSTCGNSKDSSALEKIFSASVLHGAVKSSIEFDTYLLTLTNNRHVEPANNREPAIPLSNCYQQEVSALVSISLLEACPKIDWVASKLNMSRRTLQRSLEREGHSFSRVLEGLLKDRAIELLRTTDLRLTDIAIQLGYSDSAHFTRAFKKWTGVSPSHYRSRFFSNRPRSI